MRCNWEDPKTRREPGTGEYPMMASPGILLKAGSARAKSSAKMRSLAITSQGPACASMLKKISHTLIGEDC
jgi:hypothetical protein